MADILIEHTDFFSIGTNDLIQYTLAVDRNNEKVAKFYQPLNPAILILIQKTIQAALNKDKSVSICGEMAGSPLYTAMFVGMGIRQLSMSPLVVPEVKERIRAVSATECRALVSEIITMSSSDDIEPVLRSFHDRANLQQSVPFFKQTDPCESGRKMKR
jgi:phosphoenolpyruvate-protein phosphotransferase (PTS system enzyme I)